jgi:hypothetical protein
MVSDLVEHARLWRAGLPRDRLADIAMITISITAEAYEAIRSSLPKGKRARTNLDAGGRISNHA